jgi:hypothetical protein
LASRVQQPRPAVGEEAACVGELDIVRGPAQQLDPELLLEQPHLAAERGLGGVQPLGGAREVALARDGEEVAQAPQVGPGPAYLASGVMGSLRKIPTTRVV